RPRDLIQPGRARVAGLADPEEPIVTVLEGADRPAAAGPGSRRHGGILARAIAADRRGSSSRHQLEDMAVGVAEVDAATTEPVVDVAVLERERARAVLDAGRLHAAEDGVEGF